MTPTLDEEIESLRARVSSLKDQLRIQTSTLLAAPSTRQLLSPVPTSTLLPQDANPFSSLDSSVAAASSSSSASAAAAAAVAAQPSPPPPSRRRGYPSRVAAAAATTADDALSAQAALQRAHNQQCLYRACAGITTFRVADPDPRAVDAGAVLGLRVEVVSRARFLRPYYVLLNRPHATAATGTAAANPYKSLLRVHRHTVPPCLPLAALAARHLPQLRKGGGRDSADVPGAGEEQAAVPKQDLARFARALRRELVRYHNRLGVVADLRKAAGLGERDKQENKKKRQKRKCSIVGGDGAEARGSRRGANGESDDEEAEEEDTDDNDDVENEDDQHDDDDDESENRRESNRQQLRGRKLVDIVQIDAEARQIRLDWADGRTGRLVVGDGGEVARLVAFDGRGARDREAVKALLGGAVRVDELAKRLMAEREREDGRRGEE